MKYTPTRTSYNARYTFSAKEKDTETGYSYFGARYYSSGLSIWLSVDPMADKYPSMSAYTYCADNPVKLVDPNGEEIGNYYDISGHFIGSDGKDDGRTYVVTDRNGISEKDGKVSVNNSSSVTLLPSKENRESIVDKLTKFDNENPNAELGGFIGFECDQNGVTDREVIRWGKPGSEGDPTSEDATVSYNPNTANRSWLSVTIAFHSHPSGRDGGWRQEPSPQDLNTSKQISNATGPQTRFMVFGMNDRNVYLYNANGQQGQMSFDTFKSLK